MKLQQIAVEVAASVVICTLALKRNYKYSQKFYFPITKVQKVTSNLFEEHEMTESTRLCWRAGLATDTVHHSPRAQVEINEHGN